MTISQRVEALGQWLASHAGAEGGAVEAYIVPTADPHNDEYIPVRWQCRQWLTGFDGSAGLAVVTTRGTAALWTDSRYWLQAATQLDGTPFALMREGNPDTPTMPQWLKAQGITRVSAPADMVTLADVAAWTADGLDYVPLPDAFDTLWTDRPAVPAEPIVVQPATCAGATMQQKLERLRQHLSQSGMADACLFTDLADLAWLLNLRGADVAYNPVFVGYLGYEPATGSFTLFTHAHTLTAEARAQLHEGGVAVQPYEAAAPWVASHTTRLDPSQATMSLCADPRQQSTFSSPLEGWRAIKTEAEAEGFRQAMLRDGVAMVQFLRWLDEQQAAGNEVTELSVDEKLTALRAQQSGYCELSFPTIAACGAHGAIVHYEATPHTNVRLTPHGLLLLDSGAQYDCGTTDLTRTIALGHLTAEERRVYTLVLKGHLRLAHLQFPEGTTGLQLDLAARQDMWAAGYDFGHGTGHGVGSHLCVHEGPHQIRKNVRPCTLIPFEPGMTITDEPGIYVEGRFGVRIENTLLCVPSRETDFGRFLRFETLTLCPYDLRAVERDLLTPDEVEQINAYHMVVRRRLMPLLTDEADKIWLARATASIEDDRG